MHAFGEFLDSYFLWRDPMIVGAAAGAICGFLGVYVVLRRMIFVSATLTQVSSVGVALAFYLEGIFHAFVHPFWVSLMVTAVASVFFALKKNFSRISQEGVIGFGYLLASGVVIILADRVTRGAHDISDILFGSAVVVSPEDVFIVPAAAAIAFLVHFVFFKDFILITLDADTATLFRYPVRWLNVLLLLTVGAVAAVATRAIGALPVFALTVLPALSALMLTENLKWVFALSALIGVLSAAGGYFFSFVFSLPTGASMATTAALFFVVGVCLGQIKIRL